MEMVKRLRPSPLDAARERIKSGAWKGVSGRIYGSLGREDKPRMDTKWAANGHEKRRTADERRFYADGGTHLDGCLACEAESGRHRGVIRSDNHRPRPG